MATELKEIRTRKKDIQDGLIDVCLTKDSEGDNCDKSISNLDQEALNLAKNVKKVLVQHLTQNDLKEKFVGSEQIKKKLQSVMTYFEHPQVWNKHQRAQIQLRTILMIGTPGNGKTLIVKELAVETGTPLIYFNPSTTEDKYVGESSKNMTAHFLRAAQFPKCILLMDEIGKFQMDSYLVCVFLS